MAIIDHAGEKLSSSDGLHATPSNPCSRVGSYTQYQERNQPVEVYVLGLHLENLNCPKYPRGGLDFRLKKG